MLRMSKEDQPRREQGEAIPDSRNRNVRGLLQNCARALCASAIVAVVALGLSAPLKAQGIPTGTPHQATLTWLAPSPVGGSGTVKGYNVYRTPTGAPNYTKINAALVTGLTLTDTTVVGGTTYGYCATTVDSNNSESACTIPVNANVPANPNAPQSLTVTAQ